MRAFVISLALVALAATPAVAQDLDALGKSVDEHPEDPKSYDAYAQQALRARRYDDVIKRVKIGTARIPEYTQGYYWLAVAYRSKKEWADAADYYRRYIEKNPTKTDPWFGLAASLEGLGDRKGAIAAYDKYISLEKSADKQRFIDLAKAELIKLDPSRAPAPAPTPVPVAVPRPPAPAPPPSADAAQLRQAADQLMKDGRLDEAITAYQRAIEADRGNIELYNNLGNCYFAQKRYADAASAFQQAVDRDPNFALGWYNLAHAERKADHKPEAVRAYRQYIRLKPDDPDPYYGLGQTLKALGDVPGAIEAFHHYVSMEKRPEEQRWVDKAKAELEVLESMQKGKTGPSGRLEKGDVFASGDRLERELERDRLAPFDDDLLDPFGGPERSRDLLDGRLRDLKDPFGGAIASTVISPDRHGLHAYGLAIAAFQRALSRQAEDVAERYQRGAELALADDARGAARVWTSVPLSDGRVDAARKSIERARAQLASK